MDPISTALANAWLQAVYRTETPQHDLPAPNRERTLTDVIEQALRNGGLDSKDPQWVDPLRPPRLVDRLV